ncbi:Chemokine-like receptor 1 [Varanus komodoensis]|uniref:chemokine-like receptor 1 n=1 Tax=Varanus komodoensis TaxID=61221 RepID=UPI001CF7D135|nr:chemokine-like receptor 1 [Varanus komodoensis]KAF7236501.1 Chemokine-like receptor 1 [Varanus komodoensis]
MDPSAAFADDQAVHSFSWNESWSMGPSLNTTHISWAMKMFSMAIFSITFLLGATGNGLVIYVTGFHMKKTVTTIWYLNLAVADFIFAICLSLDITYMALGHWPLGRVMCKLDTVVPFLNMFASVFFLTAISADRYVSVVHPVWALNHRTLRLASLMAAVIWAMALGLSSPYFTFRDTEQSLDGKVLCTYTFGPEDATDPKEHRSVVATELVLGFVIPFNVILACYCAIIVKLKGKLLGRVGRSFRIIVAIVVAFFCCWFPYHVFSILETLDDDSLEMKYILDIGLPLAYGLICLNSCLNPLLYAFLGLDCRKSGLHSPLSAFKGAFSENWATASFSSHRSTSSTSGVESSLV